MAFYVKTDTETILICSECPYATTWPADLIRHKKEFHQYTRMYQCNKCTTICFTMQELGKHTKKHDHRVSCPLCSASYSRAARLRTVHMPKKHNVPQELICSYCFKISPTADDNALHKQAHRCTILRRLGGYLLPL